MARRYRGKGKDARIAQAAAEVEGTYYGKLTRVEEIVAFANRIGAKNIGIATCIGLIEEARLFVKVLEAKGLKPYSVLCKVGSVDKTEVGIPDNLKIQKGCHESICNPILQARLLNEQKNRTECHRGSMRGARFPLYEIFRCPSDHPYHQGSRVGP